MHSSSPLVRGLAALLLFGSVPCTIRFIQLDSIAIGVVRLSLAALGLGIVVWLKHAHTISSLSKRDWCLTILAGLAFGLHWLFYFLGIKLASASLGALGFSTYGAQLIVLSWILKVNEITIRHCIGVGLAILGSIVLIPEFQLQSDITIGLLSGFLSGTFYALLPVIHKKNNAIPNDIRALGQFVFALCIFIPLTPFATWEASAFEWSLALYLGLIVTLIGHTLWVQATTALPTYTTSVISYLYLPAAVFLSWLFLDEEITPAILAGGFLIIFGNLIALQPQKPALQ